MRVMVRPMKDAAPESRSSTATSFRFGVRSLFAATALLSVLFAAFGWYYRAILGPRLHANEVEELIRSLETRRPADMTRAQWDEAVWWTDCLHGNSLLSLEADVPTIDAFEDRLRDKLAGDVDMQTIHWIWDEYAHLCPGGAHYQRFKVQMLEDINSAGPNVVSLDVP